MRRILFASVLKACEVRKEPGLGYSSNLGLTIHPVNRGKAGAGVGREYKLRLSYHAGLSYGFLHGATDRHRDVLAFRLCAGTAEEHQAWPAM